MASLICPRATTTCLRTLTNTRFTATKTSGAPCLSFSASATRASRQLHHQNHHHTVLSISRQTPIVSRTPAWPQQRPSDNPLFSSSPRHAFSTTTRNSNGSQTPSTSPSSQQINDSSSAKDVLTWNRFFDLRKKRRYINLASSIFTGIASVVTIGPVVAQQDLDGWLARASGLDPFVVLCLTTFTVGAGGWLCGPSFGSALFRMWASRKGWTGRLAEKEKSFFARIKRYRADPSSSSPQNPVPDYYGEKIASVKDYRRWLKDQRAFNLKKDKNLL